MTRETPDTSLECRCHESLVVVVLSTRQLASLLNRAVRVVIVSYSLLRKVRPSLKYVNQVLCGRASNRGSESPAHKRVRNQPPVFHLRALCVRRPRLK